MIYQNEQEANEACHDWQERLRLQDWDVKVQIARESQFTDDNRGCDGECLQIRSVKNAHIRIVDPADYHGRLPTVECDHEHFLVHELLHLHFGELNSNAHETEVLEQGINSLAKAIVALKRGER